MKKKLKNAFWQALNRYEGEFKEKMLHLWVEADRRGLLEGYLHGILAENIKSLDITREEAEGRWINFARAGDEVFSEFVQGVESSEGFAESIDADIQEAGIDIDDPNIDADRDFLEQGVEFDRIFEGQTDNIDKGENVGSKDNDGFWSMDEGIKEGKKAYIREHYNTTNDAMEFPNSRGMYADQKRADEREARERMNNRRFELEQAYISRIGGLSGSDTEERAIMVATVDAKLTEEGFDISEE